VLPTPSTILTLAVLEWSQLTVEITNLDATQTLTVEIWRRCSNTGDFSKSPFDPFSGISPGDSACADMDVSGSTHIQLRATASGIGLSCRMAGLLTE
jgi:hypothetical protein